MRGKASLNGKGFRCTLFGYILQTIGLDLMVSMGLIETAEKTVYSLLTFDAIRSVYALAKYYTGSFTSIDISDSLH